MGKISFLLLKPSAKRMSTLWRLVTFGSAGFKLKSLAKDVKGSARFFLGFFICVYNFPLLFKSGWFFYNFLFHFFVVTSLRVSLMSPLEIYSRSCVKQQTEERSHWKIVDWFSQSFKYFFFCEFTIFFLLHESRAMDDYIREKKQLWQSFPYKLFNITLLAFQYYLSNMCSRYYCMKPWHRSTSELVIFASSTISILLPSSAN